MWVDNQKGPDEEKQNGGAICGRVAGENFLLCDP